MLGFKGFHKNWTCLNSKKYKIGKTYKEDIAKLCEYGMHFCRFPLDVFYYYKVGWSKYALIETDEKDIDKNKGSHHISSDTKNVTKKMKILKELSLKDMIEETIKMIKEEYENNFLYLKNFYKISKDSIKVDGPSKAKKLFVTAISKIENGLVFNDFQSSISLATESEGVAITTGNNSVSLSRHNSISSGKRSISVTFGDKDWRTKSYNISTGNESMSISNDDTDCITYGDHSICSSITNNGCMRNKNVTYGKNSIISAIGNALTAKTCGDNSGTVLHGSNSTKILLDGKNSVSVFFGTEKYIPDYTAGVHFSGKLGSIFIFPIYKRTDDIGSYKFEYDIVDFMVRKVDNKDLKEDVVYEYVNNKIIETLFSKDVLE